jgi:hypothetical protein
MSNTQKQTFESVVNRLIKQNKNLEFFEYELQEEKFSSGRPMVNIVYKNAMKTIPFEILQELANMFYIVGVSMDDNSNYMKVLIYGLAIKEHA